MAMRKMRRDRRVWEEDQAWAGEQADLQAAVAAVADVTCPLCRQSIAGPDLVDDVFENWSISQVDLHRSPVDSRRYSSSRPVYALRL